MTLALDLQVRWHFRPFLGRHEVSATGATGDLSDAAPPERSGDGCARPDRADEKGEGRTARDIQMV